MRNFLIAFTLFLSFFTNSVHAQTKANATTIAEHMTQLQTQTRDWITSNGAPVFFIPMGMESVMLLKEIEVKVENVEQGNFLFYKQGLWVGDEPVGVMIHMIPLEKEQAILSRIVIVQIFLKGKKYGSKNIWYNP